MSITARVVRAHLVTAAGLAVAAGLMVGGCGSAARPIRSRTTHASVRSQPRALAPTPASVDSTASPPQWLLSNRLARLVGGVAAATGAQVGVAVRPLDGGRAFITGALQIGSAWSTMKVPVILARYRLAIGSGQASTAAIESLAQPAIEESDNAAALALFEQIEAAKGGIDPASAFVQSLLRESGDERTVVNTIPPAGGYSTFGQTQWSLAEGTRFYRALADGCLQPVAADAEIRHLMTEVEPSQRWGLGSVSFAGVSTIMFKGGWGPNPMGDYLVRQFGIVRTPTGRGFVLGLMAEPASGTFDSGVMAIDALSEALARSLRASNAPQAQGCQTVTAPHG